MSFNLIWTDYPEQFDDDNLLQQEKFQPPFVDSETEDGLFNSHLLIKGDNYPVLKMLGGGGIAGCPDFCGTVDLIYIDPPYNTGNDFTYTDKFLVRDAQGQADRHSQWLSFMQRRLLAALPLLKPAGCIFIAIDQSELYVL